MLDNSHNQPWSQYWDDFRTNWTFPPAADPTFVKDYFAPLVGPGNLSVAVSTRNYIVAAIQTLPRPEEGEFGAETSVVHLGDAIEVDWSQVGQNRRKSEERRIGMNCVVCAKGKQDGNIFNACGNYTEDDTFHWYNRTDTIAHESVVLDRLQHILSLPAFGVGVCYLALFGSDGMNSAYDVTLPFPVLASPRFPHWRFSAKAPAGIADATIADVKTAAATMFPGYEEKADEKPSVGIIVGVTIAVFVFTCLVVAIIWFVWTRTRRTRVVKRVDTPGAEGGEELRRVQNGGVQRRVERNEHDEAPPAYHESLSHQIVMEGDARFGRTVGGV